MSTGFYLVRHAVKQKGIGDVSISPLGIQQARMTAAYFRNVPISRICCSPLNRAKQTAKIIAEAVNKPFMVEIRLRERANWGDLPGQTFQEFIGMWNRCTRERDFVPPVGDSARKAGERLSSCLVELSAQHPNEKIVIVTHGGLITDFMVNEFSQDELNAYHPDFVQAQSRLVSECSITHIKYVDGRPVLIDFATITHLLLLG
ncbi:histidine phosphatase family protein [Paenibacillus ihbetae]|uniref:Histidine phosphatase family protein n=1 Tax=Paenibacillus ihbetae TaxID=1870820 RepID=A0ABX3JUB9_9BACL|nr:histidine phosphatase family protein [Paenibacillus ihbetae]OOC61287.1 histidine phosphatase family protein [Paenibacillus ihbetae]